ncbi:MAG: bifunctional DNA-binding transcriptional regulator/O6-methylguanine-DNA methyltransferase Ada [Sphingobium sp.]|nr:bifunctional DNA-binding transcriptional regulator/O6-methylguanine-DNA methyltransferase Ada [Sphingobium sp.]MCP5397951.1 bifunctional DNA-binding transcriptional regulator/O6-methylguanine-DNA methyltransferase Ada [Sphingomonas sp.]
MFFGEDFPVLTLRIDDEAYAAFLRRDRAWDGRVIIAVRTTGIYCKPSCAARRPRRENIEFYDTPEEARYAGYRACMRCRPDDVGRDEIAIRRAVELLEAAEERMSLEELAQQVGYAPHHFQRLFKRSVGVSPAAYARRLRQQRAERALSETASVTDAIYDAGYSGPSRFYAQAGEAMGMTPMKRKKGGAGVQIRYAIVDSALGKMLVAATDKGLCRISFDEGEAELRAHFPNAEILPSDAGFDALVQQVIASVDAPDKASGDLPLDIRGTAFQQTVWDALRRIPAGETRSYAQIAAEIGRPKAVRAVGTACGDNEIAIVIPCHRVLRSDGSLGGYAYGLERKRALLERERG